jgi:hypothetical protein
MQKVEPAPINVSPILNVTLPEMRMAQPEITIQNNMPEQKAGDISISVPQQAAPNVSVNMPDVNVNVATPAINIDANIQPNDVNVSLPARKTETTVEYDSKGNIKSTTQVEKDI